LGEEGLKGNGLAGRRMGLGLGSGVGEPEPEVFQNPLHTLRKFYIRGEGVRRSIEWLILWLITVGARVSYHARHWYVHVSLAFPLAGHHQEAFDSG
jgi:hypothetical protein